MPNIADCRLETAAATFLEAVLGILKCKSTRVIYTTSVNIDHDIVRYIFRNKGAAAPDGFMLYEKDDVCRLCLPSFWYYYFDELGQGVAIDFPVKLKTKLTFHSKRFVLNNSSSLVEGPLIPLEKIIVVINRRAFSQDKLT